MRLRNALAVGVIGVIGVVGATGVVGVAGGTGPTGLPTANAATVPAAVPVLPGPPEDRQPTCGKASDRDFPISTRIHGGPVVQHAGGDFRQWDVDLTNTTTEICHNIHPVILLVGRDSGLTPSQITLEFYDETTDRWRPVVLETTSEDEIVGVLDGGFPGFVVPARKSLTVKARLAFAADTTPNEITVNAAIVQKQGDDGDWVGESGDYRFTVVEEEADADGTPPAITLDELATTGPGSVLRAVAVTSAVLLCGGALVLAARRLRRR